MVEDWKNARQWIISTGVESMDNRSIQFSEDLLEFAESLRDGVILCDIANMLKRNTITHSKKVNNPVQHEFLCKRNIDMFLRACENTFHIDSKHLFTSSELYLVSNFKAVIATLSALSNTTEATTIRRWTPFAVGSRKSKKSSGSSSSTAQQQQQEEDLYGTLPEIIEQRVPPNYINTEKEAENIYDEVEKTYDSRIYDSLLNHSNKIQPLVSPTAKPLAKREHIINEMLDTEEGYLANLKTMIENYITPLRSHISHDDKELIFMNTEKIYMLHLNFHRELANKKIFKSASDDANSKLDVSAFARYKSQFLIYSYYCTHLDEAQRRVVELMRTQVFRTMIEDINKKLDRKFPLQEQLAVCFQRVLKYPLLLRDLKKNTPEDHEDYQAIQVAFEAMDDVAKFINEYKRDTENVSAKNQIICSLKFDMPMNFGRAKEYGRHLKDGELQVQFENSDKKEKRFAFLFEHALLLCKNKGDSNEVKEVLDLAKYELEDAPAVGRGNFSHCLTLKARNPDGHAESKNCRVLTKTQQMKIYWISAIRKCINAVTLCELEGQLDKHQFSLTTFDLNKGDSCGVCKRLLLGQISQGYLCSIRGCQQMAHLDCLPKCPPCTQESPSPKPHRPPHIGKSASQVIKKKPKVQRMDRAKTLEAGLPPSLALEATDGMKRFSLHKQKSLDMYSWFAGILSRDEAGELLKGSPDGSFLIRESEKGYLVISIQYNKNSFHIKITEKSDNVYLTDAKQFPSVEELLSYYQSNTLGASFPTVPSKLNQMIGKPVKRNMVVIYNWEAQNLKELTLKIGQVVSVLQDDGNWWLGICEGKQGYFPKNYVK